MSSAKLGCLDMNSPINDDKCASTSFENVSAIVLRCSTDSMQSSDHHMILNFKLTESLYFSRDDPVASRSDYRVLNTTGSSFTTNSWAVFPMLEDGSPIAQTVMIKG